MRISEAKNAIRLCMEQKIPCFVHGAPGIGKSDSVRQLGEEQNRSVIDLRMSLLNPVDLRGVPVAKDGQTAWWAPSFLPKEGNAIVFLDELNAAPPAVQCLRPEEVLLGDNRPIGELSVGSVVLSSGGSLQRVRSVFRRNYKGQLVRIKGRYLLPIECTDEHPILVCTRTSKKVTSKKTGKPTHEYRVGKAFWKKPRDVKKGDCLVVPKAVGVLRTRTLLFGDYIQSVSKVPAQVVEGIPLNTDTAELLGLYVAEGSANRRVQLAFGSSETDLISRSRYLVETWFGYSVSVVPCADCACTKVLFGGSVLERFFKEHCGDSAKTKRIPDFILFHEDSAIVAAFLRGYFAGDGHPSGGGNPCSMTTASKTLALQLQRLGTRFGIMFSIIQRPPHSGTIRGKVVRSGVSYVVQGRQEEIVKLLGVSRLVATTRPTKHFVDAGDFLAVPVETVSLVDYDGDVCNVETDDHTIIVSNAVTHNSAAYQLVLDRKVGEYTLPEGCDIVAAGNRGTDRAIVYEMSSALRNRFCHFELDVDLDEWKDWALQHGIRHEVISFLNLKSDRLFFFDSKSHKMNFPTPRSWSFASRLLEGVSRIRDKAGVFAGVLGEGVATEFVGYLRVVDKIPNAEDVVIHGNMKIKPPEDNSSMYAFSGALVGTVVRQKDLKILFEASKNLAAYCTAKSFKKEFAILTLKDFARSDAFSKVDTKLIATKEWQTLCKEYGSIVLDKS